MVCLLGLDLVWIHGIAIRVETKMYHILPPDYDNAVLFDLLKRAWIISKKSYTYPTTKGSGIRRNYIKRSSYRPS